MTASLKSTQHAVSVWHFGASRVGLVPILIADCVIAFFYTSWSFSDGVQGLPPKYTLVLLAAVHGSQLFVFLLELAVHLCQWVWAMLIKAWRNLDAGEKDLSVMLGVMVLAVLGMWIAYWYDVYTDPRTEGTVHTPSGLAVYKHYHYDQSVHYYMERKDPRDGIVVIVLCTDSSGHLGEKTYVRCLYRKTGVVMGRPPMRAPGSWVIDPLTETDTRVLEALKEKGVIK